MELTFFNLLLAICAAAASVSFAVLALSARDRSAKIKPHQVQEPVSLLFEDGVLHHATNRAAARFALHPGEAIWADLRDAVLRRFPDFPENTTQSDTGQITLNANDVKNAENAQISWRGSFCWVDFTNDVEVPLPHRDGKDIQLDRRALLERASDTSPNPCWQTDVTGAVIWSNKAYQSLVERAGRRSSNGIGIPFENHPYAPANRMLAITERKGPPDWYDVSASLVDGITTHHATSVNAVVEAEQTQKSFVQTLAKTFAQLSIGLAIFDRNGQLTIFNPALVDLSGLPVRKLSARPTMVSFFDQLRENRRMPEPKNYNSWRQELTDMISAAADGRYQETWTLETGQTYHVTGRPHPDGATAFLFEDKSAEMTLTRNFRAELEQAQQMIDALDDAVVVFSAAGVLTFCNSAYRSLWKVEPETAFSDVTIHDSVAIWSDKAVANSTPFAKIESYAHDPSQRGEVFFKMQLRTGQSLSCTLLTLAQGATMARFTKIKNGAVRNQQEEVAQ